METMPEGEAFSTGILKVYFALRGYGFITRTRGKDIFFLRSDVAEEAHLIEGISVRFKVVDESPKPRAVEIARIG